MAGMFGLVVAGRLVQTDFVVASDTEVVIEIPDAQSINHVVLFLTGTTPFPEGMGGAVFIRWPSSDGSANWHYLGAITNEKPSVIFKVAQLSKVTAAHEDVFSTPVHGVATGSAQLGVQVESLSSLADKTAAAGTAADQQVGGVMYRVPQTKEHDVFAVINGGTGGKARPLGSPPCRVVRCSGSHGGWKGSGGRAVECTTRMVGDVYEEVPTESIFLAFVTLTKEAKVFE